MKYSLIDFWKSNEEAKIGFPRISLRILGLSHSPFSDASTHSSHSAFRRREKLSIFMPENPRRRGTFRGARKSTVVPPFTIVHLRTSRLTRDGTDFNEGNGRSEKRTLRERPRKILRNYLKKACQIIKSSKEENYEKELWIIVLKNYERKIMNYHFEKVIGLTKRIYIKRLK